MKRVLVANRGEIAVRIIRACHEEGLEAVAVYSEPDRLSPHVRAADAAVGIGPAAAAESYLHIERLLDAARRTGADAVHPGYGFLAERAEFAEAVERAGLVFVGPPPAAIRAMGEKTAARQRMAAAKVPFVPGTTEPVRDAAAAVRAAQTIGYPVMLKAVSGGGGRGMRQAASADELTALFRQAGSEAQSAFGDGSLYLEQLIERPRHVEVQVLADRHGRTLQLGERECSVQRRHQKLIEESPSPAVTPELRRQMGQAAVRAARSVGYVSAGTVEFLLAPSGAFYFLEMNTRIQVEHPVTEMVYGVDLVREQLRIATGKPISLHDEPLEPRGHAIECRITSEDPFQGFVPSTGRIQFLHPPAGPGVRWESGIEMGTDVGLFYDPLLAKLIAWGRDRDDAIRRMKRALNELMIVGVQTSQPFHRRVMGEPEFRSGRYDIGYLERVGARLLEPALDDAELEFAAVAVALAEDEARQVPAAPGSLQPAGRPPTNWLRVARLDGLR
ncbi:MAG: acetyl-CoA carboxylase biotin carboxylase subunit [Gemmatimonadetes bacterium]|nr:acetyl-CoA carboxylase biotin carboxylase subunit [Gemmatimonadota bacterium]